MIIYGSLFVCSPKLGTVSAATEFGGILAVDTTWTQAESPYTLNGNVLVENGVTLTIQPGAIINLGSYYLKVNGTLNAVGDSSDPIVFNADLNSGAQITFSKFSAVWNETTSTGCIIENALLSCPLSLSTAVKINNNVIENQINVQSPITGTPLISNNTIKGGIIIGDTFGDAIIANNSIIGSGVYFGAMNPPNITLSGNTISGCSAGINVVCWGHAPHSTLFQLIEDNLIVNNTCGIVLTVMIGSSQPVIKNNTITNNTVGIRAIPDWGYNAHNSTILYNNIYGNSQYNFENLLTTNINATYNWWGTTNQQSISQSMYDFKNDFNLGTVNFDPFLTSPNANTPTCAIVTAGTGGSISSSGIERLNFGDSKTYSITPNSGYHIADVKVNGTSIGTVTSYNLQNIGGLTTIAATFAPDATPSPSSTSTPTNTPAVPEFSIATVLFLIAAVTAIAIIIKVSLQNRCSQQPRPF